MCSGFSIPVGENNIKKFQSVPEIPGRGATFAAPPAVYVTKIGPLFDG